MFIMTLLAAAAFASLLYFALRDPRRPLFALVMFLLCAGAARGQDGVFVTALDDALCTGSFSTANGGAAIQINLVDATGLTTDTFDSMAGRMVMAISAAISTDTATNAELGDGQHLCHFKQFDSFQSDPYDVLDASTPAKTGVPVIERTTVYAYIRKHYLVISSELESHFWVTRVR